MELRIVTKLDKNINCNLNHFRLHTKFIQRSKENIKKTNQDIKKLKKESKKLHEQIKRANKLNIEYRNDINQMLWQVIVLHTEIEDKKRDKKYDEQFLQDSKTKANADIKEAHRLIKIRNKLFDGK